MFVDLDLTEFPDVSPNAPPDILANYVIENPHMFNKKIITVYSTHIIQTDNKSFRRKKE